MRLETWPKAVLANSHAKPPARLVLVTLAAGCSPEGVCGIPLPRLAKLTGLSKRGVQDALDALVLLQELVPISPAKGRQRAYYQLAVPRLARFS